MQSGTKLVILLSGLALALGVISWWNRYESAHRATEFWESENARLIVEPGEVEALLLEVAAVPEAETPVSPIAGYEVLSRSNLTKALGLAHLRYALTTDSNFDWDQQPSRPIAWKWAFRFAGDESEVLVLFDEPFEILGRFLPETGAIEVVSCAPMAETLRDYFLASKSGLPAEPAVDASSPAE